MNNKEIFYDLLKRSGDWHSDRCTFEWKNKKSKNGRPFLQLAASKSKALLLTPTTKEEEVDLDKFKRRMEKYPNGTTMPNLATQIKSLLPTPQAIDGSGTGRPLRLKKDMVRDPNSIGSWRGDLKDYAYEGLLPTPTAHQQNTQFKQGGTCLQAAIANIAAEMSDGKPSKLNPAFVAEMMGFPVDWTIKPFQICDLL